MSEAHIKNENRFGKADLAISIQPPYQAWSVQGTDGPALDRFCAALFGQSIMTGSKAGGDDVRLLRLWRDRGLLLSSSPSAPPEVRQMDDMMTDISHAASTLSVSGTDAYSFLDCYTTADLFDPRIRSAGCVNCRCGHYSITAWWDRQDDIRIRIDRSYSQSFLSRLQHLANHWRPMSCVKSDRLQSLTG